MGAAENEKRAEREEKFKEVIDPYCCIFTSTKFATIEENLNQMKEKYGFWVKDGYDIDGVIGYAHEKVS